MDHQAGSWYYFQPGSACEHFVCCRIDLIWGDPPGFHHHLSLAGDEIQHINFGQNTYWMVPFSDQDHITIHH
jgi:hypothetical protein